MNRTLVGLLGREGGREAVREHLRQMADLEAGIAERREAEVQRQLAAGEDGS